MQKKEEPENMAFKAWRLATWLGYYVTRHRKRHTRPRRNAEISIQHYRNKIDSYTKHEKTEKAREKHTTFVMTYNAGIKLENMRQQDLETLLYTVRQQTSTFSVCKKSTLQDTES